MVQPKPIFDPASEIPKDIVTKRGEDTSGMQLYRHANFEANWRF